MRLSIVRVSIVDDHLHLQVLAALVRFGCDSFVFQIIEIEVGRAYVEMDCEQMLQGRPR